MSFSSSKRRRIKPYARPTSFDYNVRYDVRQYQDVKFNRVRNPYCPAAADDECFRVMEGEILVKNLTSGARYNDKELHVFSCANGLGDANGDERSAREEVMRSIQYAGVAVTEFSPARDVYEQGFVATIAGLNTLYNNSMDTIYPGQTICMDLPKLGTRGSNKYNRALQTGVPREKLQFVVRPLDAMVVDYPTDLAKKFIIGTAMSYSRPGDTVDVILHRINYTCGATGQGSGGSVSARLARSSDDIFSVFDKAISESGLSGPYDNIDNMIQRADAEGMDDAFKAILGRIKEVKDSLKPEDGIRPIDLMEGAVYAKPVRKKRSKKQ